MNFLIIRFRQMGDTVLTTPLADTLKATFPDCRVNIILNDSIAPLLQGHPSFDNIITFTNEERHKSFIYMNKVWRTMRATRYDAIFDLRSNINTLIFDLFSMRTKIRSGINRGYTELLQTHSIPTCAPTEQMIDHNLRVLEPLAAIRPIEWQRRPSLYITKEEKDDFRKYMKARGIDFTQPVMIAGVTAKIEAKCWSLRNVTEVLHRLSTDYPTLQIVLNYAPGREAQDAKHISEALGAKNIFINIEAKGLRQLMAMAACSTLYFGNEGGARHIMDAMGKPTFSICSPKARRKVWIPVGDERHQAIAPDDLATPEQLATMTYEQQYNLITPDIVYSKLQSFLKFCRKG